MAEPFSHQEETEEDDEYEEGRLVWSSGCSDSEEPFASGSGSDNMIVASAHAHGCVLNSVDFYDEECGRVYELPHSMSHSRRWTYGTLLPPASSTTAETSDDA